MFHNHVCFLIRPHHHAFMETRVPQEDFDFKVLQVCIIATAKF